MYLSQLMEKKKHQCNRPQSCGPHVLSPGPVLVVIHEAMHNNHATSPPRMIIVLMSRCSSARAGMRVLSRRPSLMPASCIVPSRLRDRSSSVFPAMGGSRAGLFLSLAIVCDLRSLCPRLGLLHRAMRICTRRRRHLTKIRPNPADRRRTAILFLTQR